MKRKELIHSDLTNEIFLFINPHTHGEYLVNEKRKRREREARKLQAAMNTAGKLDLLFDNQLILTFNNPQPRRETRKKVLTTARPLSTAEQNSILTLF